MYSGKLRRPYLQPARRMTDPVAETTAAASDSRFRKTLTQVLIVQVVALTLLGLLQFFYGG